MTKPTGADLFWTLTNYLGTPYKYGGWDCSEAILQACKDLGVKFVDGSTAQKAATTPVPLATAPMGALGWRQGHDGLLDGAGGIAHAANETRGTVWDQSHAPLRLTYAGLIPGIDYDTKETDMAGSAKAVSAAKAAVGKGSTFSGWCEKFTRTCFGFSAKYASAKLAYQASKRDGKITVDYNAPAGVPVFWDITSGVNAPYDHIAVSVGGGYCISTSAGPRSTVAKVRIADLTKRWGMRYLGWGDHYHGVRVYTAPKTQTTPSKPKGDAKVLAWQRDLNKYAKAGLFEDGIEGRVSRNWRSWVRQAQTYLDNYNGVRGKVVVDEHYGPGFANQVKTVQRRNGLHPDGIIGPVMIAWMRRQGSTGMPDRPSNRP